MVLRDGTQVFTPVDDVDRGDVVILSAGATIPGDCRILDSHDLFVDEASLTSQYYPAAKTVGLRI